MSLTPVRAALALLLGLVGAAAGAAPALAAPEPTVGVAVVVPLVLPADTTGLATAEDLALYTAPLGFLTRELDAAIDRPVAIAIDPMIIASIRVLGVSAPVSATQWLERLAGASNQTFALTYHDADLTLATQAGSATVPEPQSFAFTMDPANFAPTTDSTDTPTPAPTVDPNQPVLPAMPSTREVLDWPYSLDGIAWPRADSVVSTDLPAIEASGYGTTIVSSSNLSREGSAGSVVDVAGQKVVVSDSAVSAAFDAAVNAPNDDDWVSALAKLSDAVVAAGRAQSGGSPAVMASLNRFIPFAGGRLADTLSALASSAAVEAIPLSRAMAAPSSPATIADEAQAADRVSLVSTVLSAERDEQQFASVAKDPLAITAPRRLELLALLSNQWASNPAGWPSLADNYLTASASIVNSVEVVAASGINLLADRATLPVSVTNKLDQAVTVFISVRPDTALLAVGSSRVKLVIEPNSQGKGQIPVQAISNGTVEITVSLTSSSGVPIGTPTRTQINVQAGWETPVVIVIAVLVVAMFTFGIIRSILRRRRRV